MKCQFGLLLYLSVTKNNKAALLNIYQHIVKILPDDYQGATML